LFPANLIVALYLPFLVSFLILKTALPLAFVFADCHYMILPWNITVFASEELSEVEINGLEEKIGLECYDSSEMAYWFR
jgi:hypothetical protein